jgi:hypothetical protein
VTSSSDLVTATATCTGGKLALGGGATISTSSGSAQAAIRTSYPSSSTVWTVIGERLSGSGTITVTTYVVCG